MHIKCKKHGEEAVVSQGNTLYLVNRILAQLPCVTEMFLLHKSRLRSDLIRQKVNVFLLQPDSRDEGKLQTQHCGIKMNILRLCARQDGAWRRALHNQDASSVYQFQGTAESRTRGSTRPPGSPWPRSRLHPHTPDPHRTPSPFHIYTLGTARGSISDCRSRLCRPLCRNLCGEEERQCPRSLSVSW